MKNKLVFFQTDRKIAVGLFSNDQMFWKIEDITSSSQNEKLLSTIQIVIENAKAKNINTIATTKGPGSFTSIRILLSAAMGLSTGYNCSCFLPTVFDLLAHNKQPPFYITIDSKRGTHFTLLIKDKIDIDSVQELYPEDLHTFKSLHSSLPEVSIDNNCNDDDYYISLLKNLYHLTEDRKFISQDFSPLYLTPLMYKKVNEQFC